MDAAPRRKRWRWLVLGEHQEPPASDLNPIVEPDPDRIGICCSGGGIRSASFNLGVLQKLQADGVLAEADYLAAVSGGSYIAAAFAMVAKTDEEDVSEAASGSRGSRARSSSSSRPGTRSDSDPDSDPDLIAAAPPFGPGSPEEQYLRNRVSYIAPTGTGKAYLAWRVLLGLLINLALIGAVVALAAALLTLYYRQQDPGLTHPPPVGPGAVVGATPDGWVWGVGLSISAFAILAGAVAILSRPRRRFGTFLRRVLEVWSLLLFATGLLIFVLELVVPELIGALRSDSTEERIRAANGIAAGLSASVAGIVAAILVQLRAQTADPGKAIQRASSRLRSLAPRARLLLIYLATWVLGPLLIFALLVAAVIIQLEKNLWIEIGVPVVAALLLILFNRFGDLNAWSLHPFYRHRLCTAFALRRVRAEGDPPTGRAEPRNEAKLPMLSDTAVNSPDWPELIVCAAANVSDPGAAPPGRSVTSFTFSHIEMGGPLIGGVETAKFENALSPKRRHDFTLPAVVAMSGAAISPSMGKFTRPSIRLLMGMANVRLGVWLANPRRMESFLPIRRAMRRKEKGLVDKARACVTTTSHFKAEDRQAAIANSDEGKKRVMPRPSPRYLLKELLGWNSINDKFLYVTDGGHYENLGLVELLRRGCGQIYCFDASGGKQLNALGDAIALARSELGVDIEFADEELGKLKEGEDGLAASRCATGKIRFTRSTTSVVPQQNQVCGKIVYAPTVMTAKLPWDVRAFKEADAAFPHHSTVDQLFTDQKFEAYRVLGWYAAESAIRAMSSSILKAVPGGSSVVGLA